MSKYVIYQDMEHCIGCYSCEIHCKANKALPEGPRLCRVYQVGPRWVGSVPRIGFSFMACFHCEHPLCVAVCPSGAMQQRSTDGIVFIDQEKCIGCMLCLYACPWGVPQWVPEANKAVKCDMCVDRIDQGLKPACVTKCITGCLHFQEQKMSRSEQRRVQPVNRTPADMFRDLLGWFQLARCQRCGDYFAPLMLLNYVSGLAETEELPEEGFKGHLCPECSRVTKAISMVSDSRIFEARE